jgi:hypothetical protein
VCYTGERTPKVRQTGGENFCIRQRKERNPVSVRQVERTTSVRHVKGYYIPKPTKIKLKNKRGYSHAAGRTKMFTVQ